MDTGSIISDLSGFLDRLVASVCQDSQLGEDDKVIMEICIYDYSQISKGFLFWRISSAREHRNKLAKHKK